MKPTTSLKCGALAALLMGTAVKVMAVQITFQVNLGIQTALGKFNPATDFVLVSGSFNNWSTAVGQLSPSPTDTNVWVGSFDLTNAPGTTMPYKFIMNTASGGVVWEGNVGPNGAQNRSFTMPSTDQTLNVVYFNNVTNSTISVTPVTFQVNMSVQIAQKSFDPTSGTLAVAGDAINNWSASASPLTQSLTDTNIWEGTFNITNPPGSTVAYKYVMNGTWESIGNRSFTLANAAQVLPVVYFNNVTNVAGATPLTFQVNMAVQAALGNFNMNSDSVEARGTFYTSGGNWLGGFILTNDPAGSNPYLYGGTWVDTNDAPGSAIQYQFVINGAVWETAVGNRAFTLTSTNQQTLPLVFFNNANNLGSLTMGPIVSGQATLSWTGAPNVRLQSATDASGSWTDVANTLGQSTATVNVGPGQMLFRLTGP